MKDIKSSKDDLKGLRSMAQRLDKLKDDYFYCEEKEKFISKAYTKYYDLLESQFEKAVAISAQSRGCHFNDVIAAIYDPECAEALHKKVAA